MAILRQLAGTPGLQSHYQLFDVFSQFEVMRAPVVIHSLAGFFAKGS